MRDTFPRLAKNGRTNPVAANPSGSAEPGAAGPSAGQLAMRGHVGETGRITLEGRAGAAASNQHAKHAYLGG